MTARAASLLAACLTLALPHGQAATPDALNVRDFGATGSGTVRDTSAIQGAIDAAARQGGGKVVVPPGTFLTAPIQLRSGVRLHLEKGATLLGSPDIADYPNVPMKHIAHPEALPRMRSAALLYADEAHDIAITGEGVIDCNGRVHVKEKDDPDWTEWRYERRLPATNSLPRVCFLAGCSNVLVRSVTVTNGPAGWSWWIHDGDDVLIEDSKVLVDVRYPNNDGFHINSSRNVMIRGCTVESGDDAIVLRANNRTLAENRVCENVVVSNCTLRSYSGAVRIGWTNDGTIRNCLLKDLRIVDSSCGLSVSFPPAGGWNAYDFGREATRIENILFEDIEMDGIYGRPVLVRFSSDDPANPMFDDIRGMVFRNVRCRGLEPPLIRGRPGNFLDGISFENCRFDIVGEDQLPDYRHHGCAFHQRKHGLTNIYSRVTIRGGGASARPAADAMRSPRLSAVRLRGVPAEKMDGLLRERLTSEFAQRNVFGEARRAFVARDDDEKGHGGFWRGEFWGKQMLSAARVAEYLEDADFTAFVREECHRLMALQDEDGYLGSYRDPGLVAITDPEATKRTYGWGTVWNIWGRKYTMWAMLEAFRATGDGTILASVVRQMDQLMAMLAEKGLGLAETGAAGMCGLPSMSLLKPLVLLYEETGEARYRDFARGIVADWDREDGRAPNLLRNAAAAKPLRDWYPEPERWAKSYELMSCLEGLLEYHRVTGEAKVLEAVRLIRDNLAETEANPLGGVGFADKFIGAPLYANAVNEVCDLIHWIRLNVDLFLITGEGRYLDAVEAAYFNGYLAGIWRGGRYGAFFVRGHGRHTAQIGQCGYGYNHCCVDNLPRTFMDIASIVVTRDRKGTYCVNFYQDATVELDGVRFEISGNYPVGDTVTVRVSQDVPVEFRRPAWCPKMEVTKTAEGYRLSFDMNPRVVDRSEVVPGLNRRSLEGSWACQRYLDWWNVRSQDLLDGYRTTAAAQVLYGPLVLAKSRLAGNSREEITDPRTVNGQGYSVKATPLPSDGSTWGLWRLELTKPGAPAVSVRACDFQSGSDVEVGRDADLFSIWF